MNKNATYYQAQFTNKSENYYKCDMHLYILIFQYTTAYMVHLTVILIWRFGEFVFIHQIKCTHTLHLYVSMIFLHGLDNPCCQTNYPPIYIIYQFTKPYFHRMYHIYSILYLANILCTHLVITVAITGKWLAIIKCVDIDVLQVIKQMTINVR